MPFYRKKPVVVEMLQWTGENFDEMDAFVGNGRLLDNRARGTLFFRVAKGSGEATIHVGDWIARERDGKGVYPITKHDQQDGYEADPEP